MKGNNYLSDGNEIERQKELDDEEDSLWIDEEDDDEPILA